MATNEECKFVYNLVQVHIPHPVKLVMLKAKTKRNPHARMETPSLVCLKQVHEVFVGDAISYRYFNTLATALSPAVIVEGEDLKVLVRLTTSCHPTIPSNMACSLPNHSKPRWHLSTSKGHSSRCGA